MSIILFQDSRDSGYMLYSKLEHHQRHGSLGDKVILIEITVKVYQCYTDTETEWWMFAS